VRGEGTCCITNAESAGRAVRGLTFNRRDVVVPRKAGAVGSIPTYVTGRRSLGWVRVPGGL